MNVRLNGKKPVGLQLTPKEQKLLNEEISKQIVEKDAAYRISMHAAVLWTLHVQEGWGKKKLRAFYDAVNSEFDRLLERYEMPDSDYEWLCVEKLKSIGVDLEEWSKETLD